MNGSCLSSTRSSAVRPWMSLISLSAPWFKSQITAYRVQAIRLVGENGYRMFPSTLFSRWLMSFDVQIMLLISRDITRMLFIFWWFLYWPCHVITVTQFGTKEFRRWYQLYLDELLSPTSVPCYFERGVWILDIHKRLTKVGMPSSSQGLLSYEDQASRSWTSSGWSFDHLRNPCMWPGQDNKWLWSHPGEPCLISSVARWLLGVVPTKVTTFIVLSNELVLVSGHYTYTYIYLPN